MTAKGSGHVMSGSNGTVDVEFVNDLAVVRMNRGENRINDDFIDMMHAALDEVERYTLHSLSLLVRENKVTVKITYYFHEKNVTMQIIRIFHTAC